MNKLLNYLVILLFAISVTAEQSSLDMFEQDAARTVFSSDIEVIQARFSNDSFTKDPATKTTKLTPQEEIRKKYGDPRMPHPVKAIDDAPAPYKAMIEALKLGDDKLAFAYAKQYETYIEDLRMITGKAVGLTGQAKKSLGNLPEGSWADSERYEELKVSIGLEDQEEDQEENQLNNKALALLAKAKKSPNDLTAGSIEDRKNTIELDRIAARRELKGKLPFVPTGQVDLLFFFKPQQSESIKFGTALNQFYLTTDDSDQVTVIGFSVRGKIDDELNSFKKDTGAKYRVTGGQTLSQKMAIQNTPTLVIVDPESKKFYHIEKLVSSAYLAEALKMVRGVKWQG